MIKSMKIITDDGKIFDSYKDAKRYLDKKYGDKLTALANKLLMIDKYMPMIDFIDTNLEMFEELLLLKSELSQNENDLEE